MKKIILSAAALLMTLGAYAYDVYSHTVYITKADGTTVEHAFNLLPVATFEGDNMVIDFTMTDENGGTIPRVTYAMNEVKNISFTKTLGVDDIAADRNVRFGLTRDLLQVAGLEPGTAVAIYSVSGITVARATADTTGEAAISISSLTPGTYVVVAGTNTFKFIK